MKRTLVSMALLCLMLLPSVATPQTRSTQIPEHNRSVLSAKMLNPTTVELLLNNNQRLMVDFYGDNIFRLFQDNSGRILRNPEANPEAQILVDTPRKPLATIKLKDEAHPLLLVNQRLWHDVAHF